MAGDLYFICSQYLDSEKVDEEFVVNRSIDSGRIEESFIASSEPDRFYQVAFEPKSKRFTASIRRLSKDQTKGQLIRKWSVTLKYNRPVDLSSNIYCALVD